MLNWRIFAILVPLFFVSSQALSKLIPKSIPLTLITAYAFLFGSLCMFIIHFFVSTNKSVVLPSKYLILAVAIGLLITLANFSIFKAYSLGAPQSMFNAIATPLMIIYGLVLGFIIWHEGINPMQLVGALFSIIGVVIFVLF